MSSQEELMTTEQDHHLTMGEAFERLKQNEDFKMVIMGGYLGQSVEASVSLLAVPQIKAEGRRADIMEDLIAASNLQYFFKMVEGFYKGAKDPVLSDEEEAELAALEASEQGAH